MRDGDAMAKQAVENTLTLLDGESSAAEVNRSHFRVN
jgi:hypothetical protein